MTQCQENVRTYTCVCIFGKISLIHTGLESSYDNKRRKLNGSTVKQKQQTVRGQRLNKCVVKTETDGGKSNIENS